MKRRSLETRFWKDNYVQLLPAKGKLFFIYLLMNEYVNIIHIYELPESYISLETGLTIKEIQDFKVKFQQDNKFLFKNNWIKIINADKYENYAGLTNETAKKNLFKLISHDTIQYFDTPQKEVLIPPKGGLITNNQQLITNNQEVISNNNIYTSKDFLLNISKEDLDLISKDIGISKENIIFKGKVLYDWCESKGKVYKNYKAFLKNCLRSDKEKQTQFTKPKDFNSLLKQ